MNLRRSTLAALVAAGAVATLAGCGAGGAPATAPAQAAPPSAAAGGTDTVCANLLKIDLTPTPDSGDADQPPPDEVKKFAATIAPYLDAALAAAPADLSGSLTQLKAVVTKAQSDGVLPPFEDPSFTADIGAYEVWANANCGYQSAKITDTDSALQGAPSTLKAAPASVLLTNKSAANEFQVVIVARPHDQSISLQQFLATPPDQFEESVDILPAGAAANPGQTSGMLLDLKPGRYFLLDPTGDPAPHYTKGAIAEVTVS